ncbi:histidine ammonia-lyase, partial [Mesorhizobium sp. M1C.F.Ca.ET.176.01.1.1]
QAVDLREGLVLAPATGVIHAAVRTHVATLKEDRPLGTSANALYAALTDGTWQA